MSASLGGSFPRLADYGVPGLALAPSSKSSEVLPGAWRCLEVQGCSVSITGGIYGLAGRPKHNTQANGKTRSALEKTRVGEGARGSG